MIMLLHVNFRALGCPSLEEFHLSNSEAVVRIAGEAFTIIAVNVFVLISGWFGIHFKLRRLLELAFQIFFFCLAVDLFLYIDGRQVTFNINDITNLILLNDSGYWFVRAYIVLYVLSPILNSFIDFIDRYKLKKLLILLFIVQTVQGFFTHNAWYDYGYSPLFFIFLYLLGRYMKLYPFKLMQFNKGTDLSVYTFFCLLNIGVTFVQVFAGRGRTAMLNYLSPLTIVASVYFFLIFTKMHFTSKLVNWVAISSLAVYLLHGQGVFLVNVYCANIRNWISQCSHSVFVLRTLCMILSLFIIAILLDKIRIVVWNNVVVKVCKHIVQ